MHLLGLQRVEQFIPVTPDINDLGANPLVAQLLGVHVRHHAGLVAHARGNLHGAAIFRSR